MKQPKDPRKQPRQERSVQTVDAILEAAARIFETHGFEAGNTNKIAQLAGVSVGSLYQYFPDKHSLVTALHERHTAQVLQRLEQVLARNAGAALGAIVKDLVGALLDEHLARPQLQRVLHAQFALLAHRPEESPAARALFERLLSILSGFHPARARAELEVVVQMLLRTTESLIHSVVLEPPKDVDRATLEREIAHVLDGYLKGIG
jgi:AcrR family transcriptional regulator